MKTRILALSMLLFSAPVYAGDGRLEINQTCAEGTGCFPGDGPGFPVTIINPGSYVLTSSLQVQDANTTAIDLDGGADGTSIDLNGFRIQGITVCSLSTCSPTGTGVGIASATTTQNVTVRNGTVTGMGSHGIRLRNVDYVQGVIANSNGGVGIEVGPASSVLDCQATFNGGSGIVINENTSPGQFGNAGESILRGNLATRNAITDPGGLDIEGSRSGGGNVCGDDSCSLRDARRYYLSVDGFTGGTAPEACVRGYHMASMWELFDPSNLQYATIPRRGESTFPVQADQGSGPPILIDGYGWVRTGAPGSAASSAPGQANCDAYTTANGAVSGSLIRPSPSWQAQTDTYSAWQWRVENCDQTAPVWCVEN